ncbi:MAG: DUF374 domain-containing protein [Alphaproteobacteria bacterium]|nr:DUF374 domain-containing protein [Alphaproteobacteria bacterium]
MLKTFLRRDGVRRVLCWVGAQYIRLAHATGGWTTVNGGAPRRLWDANRPFILCFWHGRILMMPYSWDRSKTIHMLISQHPDGQLIAHTVAHFGIKTAAGSSRRGGAAALRLMVRALKAGEYVGITPDGPRGPRMRASDGAVHVARMSGVPLLPTAFGARRRKVLGSWDRFIVAWPFGGGVFVWGEPIEVPRDADDAAIESARQRLEDSLNAVTAEADRLCGQPTVAPAPSEQGARP